MADAQTKYCPRCSQPLAGPGYCTRCGLKVGYGPGQAAPLDQPDEPSAPAPLPPPSAPEAPEAPAAQTHAELPRVESTYRSPGHRPPDAPTAPSPQTPQPPRPPSSRDRNALVLPMLGIVAVLALIVGGLWFLTNDDSDQADGSSQQDPAPTDSPDSTQRSTGADGQTSASGPLKVTAPFENQPCSDALIVVLASSGDPKSDDRTIEAAAKKAPDARYLQTSKSCKTFNQSLNGNPIFAAYLGPFDSMTDACQTRTDTGVAASYVRMLSLDRELREICSCQDRASELPRLSTKTAGQPSYDIALRVYDLQSLLYLAGVNPANTVTGTFGPETKQMVKAYQRQQRLAHDGWVGPQTWGRLIDQNCG